MNAERWKLLKGLFEDALEVEGPDRRAFLDDLKGRDAELHEELMSLLASDAETSHLVDGDPAAYLGLGGEAPPVTEEEVAQDARVGSRIGVWDLSDRLGAGGMGVVYRAERADGAFDKSVALKVLRRGMDTESILARFHNERRILASLEHPNIARLIDGGVTDDGLPWFAMEYVEGTHLTRYCDDRELSVDDRLRLFETVCAAVQHAQERLVVHRDLKPSNILVADDGSVKLLDFGIARVLTDADGGTTSIPGAPQALTVAYAAPEQLKGETVTTATDVYALGTILYELLVGVRPGDVRPGVTPQRPSEVAVSTQQTLGASRASTPDRLRRRLGGDLDNICLKALEVDPARRYSTAGELLEDIRRHRHGLPVEARASTLAYRASRFIARHRAGVGGAAAAALLLFATVGWYTIRLTEERDRARQEAEQSAAVTQYYTSVFEEISPTRLTLSSRGEPTVGELLNVAVEQVSVLEPYPAAHARVLSNLAFNFRTRGEHERAVPLLKEAFELEVIASDGAVSDQIIQNISGLGTTLSALGRYDEAEAYFQEAVAWSRTYPEFNPYAVGFALNNLAKHRTRMGRYVEAAPVLEEATQIYTDAVGEEHHFRAIAFANHARALLGTGQLALADSMLRRSVAAKWAAFPEGDLTIAEDHVTLAEIRRLDGDRHAALALVDSAVSARRAILTEDVQPLARSLALRGLLLVESGETAEGIRELMSGDSIFRAAAEPGHPLAYETTLWLGRAYSLTGRDAEASAALQQATTQAEANLPGGHPDRSLPHLEVGLHELSRGRPTAAEASLRRALQALDGTLPDDHWRIARVEALLGSALARSGRYDEAGPLLSQSAARLAMTLGVDHRFAEEARGELERMGS